MTRTTDASGATFRETVCREPIATTIAADDSLVPTVRSITDDALDLWTLGDAAAPGSPHAAILRNGIQVASAYGSAILWVNRRVYVLGDEGNWWQWNGTFFDPVGPTRPPPTR